MRSMSASTRTQKRSIAIGFRSRNRFQSASLMSFMAPVRLYAWRQAARRHYSVAVLSEVTHRFQKANRKSETLPLCASSLSAAQRCLHSAWLGEDMPVRNTSTMSFFNVLSQASSVPTQPERVLREIGCKGFLDRSLLTRGNCSGWSIDSTARSMSRSGQ